MAIILFAKAFAAADEKVRKELYIQFADAYEGGIKDWKIEVEDALEDVELKEAFRKMNNRTKELCGICYNRSFEERRFRAN